VKTAGQWQALEAGKSARRLLAKRSRQLANCRKDRNHKTAATLVEGHSVIGRRLLGQASANGTVEKPGTKVRQKAGLNREILDTVPGGWHSLLANKAEEAGCRLSPEIPSEIRKKTLNERTHVLPDATIIGRDQAQLGCFGSLAKTSSGRNDLRR